MTEQDFIALSPLSGSGGVLSENPNINLLISSSMIPHEPISGSEQYPDPESGLYLIGLTVPSRWYSDTGASVNLAPTLAEVDTIKIPYGGEYRTVNITARQQKDGYYFLRTEETYLGNTLPPLSVSFEDPYFHSINFYYKETGAELVFIPYLPEAFRSHNYNPLINNSEQSRKSRVRRIIDRSGDYAAPTNLDAILSQSAEFAEIQDSDYSKVGTVLSRYRGTEEYNRGVKGFDPALTLKPFKGSKFPVEADIQTLLTTAGTEPITLYFNIPNLLRKNIPSGKNVNTELTLPSLSGSAFYIDGVFHQSGSILFEELENRQLTRIIKSKVLLADKGTVLTTDEFGYVVAEETVIL